MMLHHNKNQQAEMLQWIESHTALFGVCFPGDVQWAFKLTPTETRRILTEMVKTELVEWGGKFDATIRVTQPKAPPTSANVPLTRGGIDESIETPLPVPLRQIDLKAILIRVSVEERTFLHNLAEDNRMSLNAYVRQRLGLPRTATTQFRPHSQNPPREKGNKTPGG